MPDAVEFVKTIKKAAIDAVEAAKPVYVYFGEVVSASPLKINVEQKMILGENQLILSRNVTNFETIITVEWSTESSLAAHSHDIVITSEAGGDPEHKHSVSGNIGTKNLAHTHNISGEKKIIIHNGLAVGDKVILLRQQEGQKFIVWDRVGA